MYEEGNEGDRSVSMCQERSQGMEREQKESVEAGSHARRQGSTSHLPGDGCLRWELSLANYMGLNSSALPFPPSSLLSVSPGKCQSPGPPEDSKYSSGSFYFTSFLPALQVGSTAPSILLSMCCP